jgi:hypothetical protein
MPITDGVPESVGSDSDNASKSAQKESKHAWDGSASELKDGLLGCGGGGVDNDVRVVAIVLLVHPLPICCFLLLLARTSFEGEESSLPEEPSDSLLALRDNLEISGA